MRSAEIPDVLPALLPDRIVQLTEELTGGPAALYVIDIEGSSACRLTAAAGFPATIDISGALGPEAGRLAIDDIRTSSKRWYRTQRRLRSGFVAELPPCSWPARTSTACSRRSARRSPHTSSWQADTRT